MRTRVIRLVVLLSCAVAMVLAAGCDAACPWLCNTLALIEVTNSATGEPAADVQFAFFPLRPLQPFDENLRILLRDSDVWSTVVTDGQGHATLAVEVGGLRGTSPWNPDSCGRDGYYCGRDGYLADRVLLRPGAESDSVELPLQAGAGAVTGTYDIRVLEVEEWESP